MWQTNGVNLGCRESAMSAYNPPTGTESPPAFTSALACQDWLAGLPVANPAQAQVALLRQLNLLHQFTLDAEVRFDILELLRGAVLDVQEDIAKKFAGRPLPLTPPEQAAFDGTLALWNALLTGYLRLVALAEGGDKSLADQRACIVQRALAVLDDLQADLCRGQQLPDAAYWQQLHSLFASAERLGVLDSEVNDALRQGSSTTSAVAAYAEALLLAAASPFELHAKQLGWVIHWARRWGAKLRLCSVAEAATDASSLPLFVDLNGTHGPAYQAGDGSGIRAFDTAALRKSLKSRITLLDQGEAPAKLHLGADCTQPGAGILLRRVYQRWCKGGAVRRHERKATTGQCDFVAGYMAVHYYVSGRQPFVPPVRDDSMLRKERDELATFGEHSKRKIDNYSELNGFEIEAWDAADDWHMLDQSSSGLRLRRPLRSGVRVGTGQLVAVKFATSSHYVLGALRWALHDNAKREDASLCAGIELFPGQATPVAVRPTDVREPFLPGFFLPEVAALGEHESLILPISSFRLGRPFEFVDGRVSTRVTLDRVLDRTGEYERCSFKRV
jgi:hypothetical protein